MQLPFSNKLLGSTLTAEEKQERRQQQLRRLQELNARRREEKLQLDQERLERLLYVQVMQQGPGLALQGDPLFLSGFLDHNCIGRQVIFGVGVQRRESWR